MPRHFRARLAAVGACAGLVAALPATALASELQANPATLGSVFAGAAPGDTILLASGDYGTFSGGMKPGVVTLRAAPAASVTIELSFKQAANITVEGIQNITEAYLEGAQTKNITVRGSYFSGQTTFRTGSLQNANILFDGNTHGPWDKCSGCAEARVWFPQKTSQPSGITVQNSVFGPGGDSDGIQNGSNGSRILNNTFVGITQTQAGLSHADAIQLYGSSNTLIRGNFFFDVSNCLMAPDGADHEVYEDNVCVQKQGNGTVGAIQLGSDNGSRIVHNTFYDSGRRECDYNTRCGIMSFGSKSGDPAPSGTVVQDNIVAELSKFNTSSQSESYNLLTSTRRSGTGDLFGMPAYVGGARPTTYAGYRLAPGSLGKGAASDGQDLGARIQPSAVPPPPGSTTTPRGLRPGVRLLSDRRALRKRGRVRLRVTASVAGRVVVVGSVRPKNRRRARPVRLRPVSLNFAAPGSRVVVLKASRRGRRRLGHWRKPVLVVRTFADAARQERTGRFVYRVRR
jgi:hypothetical protein